jgi:glycosyltransferase involved in cell wall biosynthesis
MRILIVHNYYQRPGGEDRVFKSEAALLEAYGHVVLRYCVHNDTVAGSGRLRLSARAIWSGPAYNEIRSLCRNERPDVVHFHNTMPLISPSAYYAAKSEGIAVVQTLHNYRLACPAATFFRDGKVCQECLGKKFAWPAITHACYRDSRPASAVVATMVGVHHVLGTWTSMVDRYIVLTEFARAKFREMGLPASKLALKPNFVDPDPGAGMHRGGYPLFVGRLAPGKGIETLLAAWRMLESPPALKVVGSGPLDYLFKPPPPRVEWLGEQTKAEVARLMRDAAFLIFPSELFETFGLSIIEAYSAGLPVIASAGGAAAELVRDGATGLLYESGNAAALAHAGKWILTHPAEMQLMQARARQEFVDRYTASSNYGMLMDIYRSCLSDTHLAVRTTNV